MMSRMKCYFGGGESGVPGVDAGVSLGVLMLLRMLPLLRMRPYDVPCTLVWLSSFVRSFVRSLARPLARAKRLVFADLYSLTFIR